MAGVDQLVELWIVIPYPQVISVTYPRKRCGQVWTYRQSVDKMWTKLGQN